MTTTDKLSTFHPDLISSFLETGNSSGIPKEIQLFLKQIQWAAEIYEYERNITRCAKKLKTRILAEQGEYVDVRLCKARIYSAIEYFDIDCNIAQKVWESNYADRYENLTTMCISKGDYKTAKLCQDAALECRRRSSAIAETEKNWAPVFLISNTLTTEDLGFGKKSLKTIARKHEDAFYSQLIDSLTSIDKEEKARLKQDADIIELEIEQITD